MRTKAISLFFTAIFLLVSCENELQSYFPYAKVGFKVNLNSGNDNGTLSIPGGYYIKEKKLAIEDVGYRGFVIVYQSYQADNFSAYDMACPNCLTNILSNPDDHNYVSCGGCSSVYTLEGFGAPLSGPAKQNERRLKSYSAQKSGNYIVVTN